MLDEIILTLILQIYYKTHHVDKCYEFLNFLPSATVRTNFSKNKIIFSFFVQKKKREKKKIPDFQRLNRRRKTGAIYFYKFRAAKIRLATSW